VKAAILNSGRKNVDVDVRCTPCSGGRTLELHCKDCDTWKHIDYFAKTQRKTSDTAAKLPSHTFAVFNLY